MKTCKNCSISFTPPRKDKEYCSERCGHIFRSRAKRKRERKDRHCLVCGTLITDKWKRKYCGDVCVKKVQSQRVSAKARKEVREWQKRNPNYCVTCNVQLKTTTRNHNQKKRCDPCGEVHLKAYQEQYRKENDYTEYFRKRHAKKMQDPEYRKKNNVRSRARRNANPVIVDCEECGTPFRRFRYGKYCTHSCRKVAELKRRNKPSNILSNRLRRGIRKTLKGGKSKSTFELLDYTPDELNAHFESYFTEESGYSWDNIDNWHIDHIRPVSSFNFTTTECEDFKKCWALENLQPLWAADNIAKGNKWDGEVNA